MNNIDKQLATIIANIEHIKEDIIEIKENQKSCPIHDVQLEVASNSMFRKAFIYILSGSGFIGMLGLLGKNLIA